MNNAQFRRLVLDTPRAKPANNDSSSGPLSTPARKDGGITSSGALGSKQRSSIPMTPRSVTGIDFARQLAERDQHQTGQTTKKFRSSAAPKGVKLPAGYVDRTHSRDADGDGNEEAQAADNPAARIAALEEMVKKGEMEQVTFEKLRDEIVGGDIGTTHLVKGLDYKLLERVRKGEDVLRGDAEKLDHGREEKEEVDAKLDEEFEKLEEKEVVPVVREKNEEKKKNGEMLPPPLPPPAVAGKKRSRNEILAELKASRKAAAGAAAAAAAQPTLGPKFKKVGEKREKTRIERDERGREILITVDENGRVKRKVRKGGGAGSETAGSAALPMPEKDAKPLGMDVPEAVLSALNEKNGEEQDEAPGNIFEDAGSDYDPLAGMEGEDDDDDDSNIESDEGPDPAALASNTGGSEDLDIDPVTPANDSVMDDQDKNDNAVTTLSQEETPPPESSLSAKPPPSPVRNYFATSATEDTPTSTDPNPTKSQFNPLSDSSILAALRKASTLDPFHLQSRTTKPSNPNTVQTNDSEDIEDNEDEESRRSRLREKLLSSASHDRDAEDLDMGFGSSRFDDVEDLEEDGGGKRVKLSVWDHGGGGGGKSGRGGGGDEGGGKQKRKRGPKKKKGDKNSTVDVLRVVEQRKKKS